jgi:hypothetical protein
MGMTRRQAENLAKGNPAIARRLKAGEFDSSPGGTPAKPKPARRTVRASAPAAPSKPARRVPAKTPAAPGNSRSAPDNGPQRPGLLKSFVRGFLDI